jgi:hypothetical protein
MWWIDKKLKKEVIDMGEVFNGTVEIRDAANARRISLEGDGARIIAGGDGQGGDLILNDGDGNQRLWIDGQAGNILTKNADGDYILRVVGEKGDIVVHRRIDGHLREVMKFDASRAALYIGSEGRAGDILVRNSEGDTVFKVRGNQGDIVVHRRIDGHLREVMKFDAFQAALYIGSEGQAGDILVRNSAGDIAFKVDANDAALYIGSEGRAGDILVRNSEGDTVFKVRGNQGDIVVHRRIDGHLREVMKFDASRAALYIGSEGNEGEIHVRDGSGNNRIQLDGRTGDIKLQGADCAEEFDVAEFEQIDPGTVLVIDDESKLRPCKEPYDKKVAGVVSGANGSNPSIILDKNPMQTKRLPIALNGKVYCKVDAQFSPIEVGDLLTTSTTEGHAMKAEEPLKAFGAVIGKALRQLGEGKGMIPILVALQ